jgi:hypothetical protein
MKSDWRAEFETPTISGASLKSIHASGRVTAVLFQSTLSPFVLGKGKNFKRIQIDVLGGHADVHAVDTESSLSERHQALESADRPTRNGLLN